MATMGSPTGPPVGRANASPSGLPFLGADTVATLDPFTGTPSTLLTLWLLADAPVTIAGNKYTCNSDAGGAVYSGVISHGNTDASGKYYAEAEWTEVSLDGGAIYSMFGWRGATYLTNTNERGLKGVFWNQSEGSWQVHRDVDGLEGGIVTTNTTPPVNGTRVGVATDQVAGKFYAHVGGVWLTDGVNGGAPADGNGWTLDAGVQTMYLWAGAKNLGHQLTALDGSEFLPAGYTAET